MRSLKLSGSSGTLELELLRYLSDGLEMGFCGELRVVDEGRVRSVAPKERQPRGAPLGT